MAKLALSTPAVLSTAQNNIDTYLSRGTTAGLRGDIAIHAPPAFGKSFLAATASQFWPGAEALGTRAVSLDDVVWCAVDRGAVDGLLVQRVEIPYLIDVRGLCEDFGAGKGTEHANSLVRSCVDAHPDIRLVVWDTVSELDKVWQVGLEGEGGSDDSQWLFRKLLARHRSHYSAAHKAAAGRRIVWLAHSVALQEGRKDAPKSFEAGRRATRLPGGAEIKLDATGQGHHLYINNASLVATIVLEEQKGRAPVRWMSSGGTTFETKNRLQGLIGEKEPFDLRGVFQRVDARLAEIRQELQASARHARL